MGNNNWFGVALVIILALGLMTFLASKITIYDGTELVGIPTASSVLNIIGNAISAWVGSFLPW